MPIDTATEGSFGHMARAAGKMMDQLQKGFVVYAPDVWTPNVNLYEAADSYFVCVDLAGVDKEKLDVEVADQRLTLRGNRPVPVPDLPADPAEQDPAATPEQQAAATARRAKVHLMEIDHGQFSRDVELPPDADREGIVASYRNGMLWIEIPKK